MQTDRFWFDWRTVNSLQIPPGRPTWWLDLYSQRDVMVGTTSAEVPPNAERQ